MQQNKDGEPQLFKQFGLFSVSVLLLSVSLYGASFEEFKRTQSESFSKYKDERDNAFNKYLKSQWQAYKVKQGRDTYAKPKPASMPKTRLQPIKKVGPKVNIQVIKHTPVKVPKKTTVVVIKQKHSQEKKDVMIDFFGSHYGFNIANGLKKSNFYPRNNKGVSNFFDGAAGSEYEELVSEIKKVQKELVLNDWALYLFVHKIASKVYTNQDNVSLFSWFIFNKLGYAVKVGLAQKHIVLMYYSEKTIYATPSYNFDKKRFYVIANYNKGGVGRVYSYPQNYPDANKPINLSLEKLPKFKNDIKYKDLSFSENGKKYEIGFNYNQNIIDFMATYPQADPATYFNAPLEEETYKAIATKLKEYVDGKKMSEAINFVLHFVQKSFKYQRDDDQFGREKFMFAQETLYYDKSDCEDRAILFANLINNLFKVGVVGVGYKTHMSTALYIPINGDSIMNASRRFVIADPTYINANIGQNMPKFKSIKPESLTVVKRK